jgi:hypothetical protein
MKRDPRKTFAGLCFLAIATLLVRTSEAAALTTLEYKIGGAQLRVSPPALAFPKGIAGSVLAELVSGGTTNGTSVSVLASGAYVEATLRGPAFPARKIVGQVNSALLLPAIPLVGDYELNDIKLVDAVTGETRMEGTPNRVPIHIFDEVLISRVTSRPLTLDEIKEKGIVIDENNFRAVEFEVGFVLDGKTIPVKFPVVAPNFQQSTEIIPAAELEARLIAAQQMNESLGASVELPPELQTAGFNIAVQGINFQFIDPEDGKDLALRVPPIPALMVVPGRIGFLNQFFSVQIFTENGAPQGSGLSVFNIQATLKLPPGPDRVASTSYETPGDDPLRFARVGPDKIIQATQQVVRPGPDGQLGTADDIGRLQPGESGQAEFLVEGLQEGLYVMDLDLLADLEGLAAGVVKVKGKAAGSVLVRNPKFSIAFSHPRTIRTGEPYDAFVTVLNTGSTVANLVQVALSQHSISGGTLESDETVQLGTLQPGQSATAKFRIRSQRTGAISFSNLTTGDDSVVGRFRLSAGVDERGVALSPDSIGMPEFVDALPPDFIAAANRVLGQAISVNTAAQLPPGIKAIPRSIITTRVLELAEAGQRLIYHDTTNNVLADLMLDWQGGRNFNDGFDQILRETDAGREFRAAFMTASENADALDATARLANRARDLAGRGEAWLFASAGDSGIQVSLSNETATATLQRSGIPQSLVYHGNRGELLAAPASVANAGAIIEWHASNAPASTLSIVSFGANGLGQKLEWTVPAASSTACYRYAVGDTNGLLNVDDNCDGVADSTIAASISPVQELQPRIISVVQDLAVVAGRPPKLCSTVPDFPRNYGTVVAVLYSKPMTQEKVNLPSAYTLDDGNSAGSVQIQPGGRIALLNLRRPISAIVPRTLTVSGVTDVRSNVIASASVTNETSLRNGVALRGRVVRADSSPAPGVPVTLTMYDQSLSAFECSSFVVRVSQVFTDTNGYFAFDYVMSGIPYSVSATDTGVLTPEQVQLLLNSVADSRIQAEKLLELANSPTAENTLLQAFALGSLAQVVAKAESLDRALLKDFVPVGSAREGQVVPVALRFRGRGTVSGTVVAADGVTPLQQVAVNLFPDPESREEGRGMFSDSSGRFNFQGVPLGIFSIQARNSSGLSRTISEVLTTPAENKNVTVVLSTNTTIPLTQLQGRVTEADGVTPHAQAPVFIGRYIDGNFGQVVACATTDANGYWTATNVTVGAHDIVALSVDGRRRGERRGIIAVAGLTVTANLTLPGSSSVRGIVRTSTGVVVSNAIVGGGEVLVRTDGDGKFVLNNVPTGRRGISVGVERSIINEPAKSSPPFDFPHFGGTAVDVVPGVETSVEIRLNAAGRIIGRVLAGNTPVPRVKVALPENGGFQWVQADNEGRFVFENMPLKNYTLSAPSPPVFENDVSHILDTLRNGDSTQDQLQTAIGDAFAIFTGAADPLLNGAGLAFNPVTWGFTTANLSVDNQTVQADIKLLPVSTVSGKVLNSQNVPIGARVRLTGIGPQPNGSPGFMIRGERNSDPALGTFQFTDQAFVGDWGLQAASPFFPVVISASGRTFPENPDATNIVLQFPAARVTSGRLGGLVLNPDGSRASNGVNIGISYGNSFIPAEADGTFHFDFDLPAINGEGRAGVEYFLRATNANGLVGASSVVVTPGTTNSSVITLLGRGAIVVSVREADGTPVPGAHVAISQGGFPGDHDIGDTDGSGTVSFGNLSAGGYGVFAVKSGGQAANSGSAGVTVTNSQTSAVVVTLGPTGTIKGRFVKRDLVTPVQAAQVAVGGLGFATTDINGDFIVNSLPLGAYRLVTRDPVTGIAGIASATLSFDHQTNQVLIVEQSLGEIRGRIVNSYGSGGVPGADISISYSDGLTPGRSITAGPQGDFSFPGSPAGSFTIGASDPTSRRSGSASGTLPENVALVQLDVQIQQLGSIQGFVFLPDGTNVAADAFYSLQDSNGQSTQPGNLDSTGHIAFTNLPFGTYIFTARDALADKSVAGTNFIINSVAPAPDFRVRLPGVGSVLVSVFQNDGVTPAPNARVSLGSSPVETDANGQRIFTNMALGPYRVVAELGNLGGSFNGTITNNRHLDQARVVLGASGAILGRLLRADGVTPAAAVDMLLNYLSQSSQSGVAATRTTLNGTFAFSNITVGANSLEAVTTFGGIARRTSLLTANGQVIDFGDIVLDEEAPRVLAISPANTAVEVNITNTIEIQFSEAMDTNTLNLHGLFVRLTGATNDVSANVSAVPNPTNGILDRVRLAPVAALQSQKSYEIVVIDGERVSATGEILRTGPRDLAGRPLVSPVISRFTTADNDPPLLVSISPTNGEIQIDPRAVMRLSFNEPIRDTNIFVSLTSGGTNIAGTASVGLNGLVLVFTPAAQLPVNSTLTLTVSNVFDLHGNAATNQPIVSTFNTLDIAGPGIALLRLSTNQSPVAGAAVTLEAFLTVDEPGATVRFTQDFTPIGTASGTNSPYKISATLPVPSALNLQPSTTLRATPTDRFGNDGPFAALTLTVVSNQPPAVSFTRLSPSFGTVSNGQTFSLSVSGADDVAVTNLTVVGLGAINFATNIASSAIGAAGPFTLSFTVPSNAVPGKLLQFQARATDCVGADSAVVVIDLTVRDTTPPALAFASPSAGALLNPATPLLLQVVSSDNNTNHQLQAVLSGALSTTQNLAVAVLPNIATTNTFSFALTNAATNGTPLLVTLRGTDSAGNSSTIIRSFALPDIRPPQLTLVTPTNNSTAQSLWAVQSFDFDEPLAVESVTTNSFAVTNSSAGAVPYSVSLANGNSRILLLPITPLEPATYYTNTILRSITDTSSNLWRNVDGSSVPAAGIAFVFKTAAVFDSTPTNGTHIFAGQTTTITANYEQGFGAALFRFALNGGAPIQVSAGPVSASVAITLPPNATQGVISITASPDSSFARAYSFPSVVLNVAPAIAPVITTDPVSLTVTQGGLASFAVVADGTSPLTYQWRFNDVPLSGATGSTFARTAALAQHSGNYSVVVANAGGSVTSATATLTVLVPPFITAQPQSRLVPVGSNVTFTIAAGGTEPLGYQWRFNGTDIPGATISSLTRSSVQPSNSGDYTVFITNMVAGLTSAVASLSVFDAPAIVTHPRDQKAPIGGNGTFTVSAIGTTPLFYQWRFNGEDIPAATSTAYTRTNVQFADAGNLSVLVTNSVGVAVSSNAQLSVLCAPTGIISWWPAEDSANDLISTNHGTINGAILAPAKIGRGFSFESGQSVQVVDSAALSPSKLTIEAWIKTASSDEWGSMIAAKEGPGAVFGYEFLVLPSSIGGRLRFLLNGGAGSSDLVGTTNVLDNQFHHVAATYDGAAMRLYVDGVLDAEHPVVTTVAYSPGSPLNIGRRFGHVLATPYSGLIDELTLYNRALTGPEINTIYNAGTVGDVGKCAAPAILAQPQNQDVAVGANMSLMVTASGAAPLAYQWRLNGTNIAGATDVSYVHPNVQFTDAGAYTVVVTNHLGGVTSSVATISVFDAPSITSHPIGQSLLAGGNAGLTVVALGTPPLTYQWRLNGQIISGATNSTLILLSAQPTDSGTYSVVVSNAVGVAASSNAVLSVVCAPPGAVSWWRGESSGADYAGTNNGMLNGGVGFVGGELGQAFSFDGIDDFVDLGFSSALQPTNGNFSLAGWFMVHDTPNNGASCGARYPIMTWSYGYNLEILGDRRLVFYKYDTLNSGANVLSPEPITTNEFHHFVAIHTSTALRLYLDGQLINATAIPNGNIFYGGYSLRIAKNDCGPNAFFFKGEIDELAFFNRELSVNEVSDLYNQCRPGIVQQPRSQTIVLNGSATFSVEASGSTPLSYQWRFNGTNVPGAISPTFSRTGVQTNHEGAYSVIITNSLGSVTSAVVTLTVIIPPVITAQPQNQMVAAGSNATFTVAATSSVPWAYQWRFNGTDIVAATNAVYTRTNVQLADAGNYFVIATNIAGATTSAVATLTVLVPPSITLQPQSQTVTESNNAVFTVVAAGSPPLAYQWQLNGTNISGATNSTLMLAEVTPAHAGAYRVAVSNIAGTTNSADALLSINLAACAPRPAGLVSWWPGAGNAKDIVGGHDGTLANGIDFAPGKVGAAFRFDGVDDSVTISNQDRNAFTFAAWVKRGRASVPGNLDRLILAVNNGGWGVFFHSDNTLGLTLVGISAVFSSAPLSDTSTFHHVAVTYNGSQASFFIDGVLDSVRPYAVTFNSSGGAYTIGSRGSSEFLMGLLDEVTVFDHALSAGEVAAIVNAGTAGLCLPAPPVITTQPQNKTVASGQDATFTIAAAGDAPLSFQWRFNGAEIPGATTQSYTRGIAQSSDVGNYSVVVTNAVGSTTSAVAVLTVIGCPPPGLLSWWPGEANTTDIIGAHNGTIQGTVTFTNGQTGGGFRFNGFSGGVNLGDVTAFDWTQTNSFTLAAWVNTFGLIGPFNDGQMIVVLNNNCGNTVQSLAIDNTGRPSFGVRDADDHLGILRSPSAVTSNQFHYVVGVREVSGSGKTLRLYIDGALVGMTNDPTTGVLANNAPDWIGRRNTCGTDNVFNGVIDEVAIFNRALGSEEIAAVYSAGGAGMCQTTPLALIQPQNQVASVGSNVTLTVTALGAPPLAYQWKFNGTNLPGATSSSLNRTNISLADQGDYVVSIANTFGAATSQPATLSVSLAPCLPAGIVSWWPGQNTPGDIIGGINGTIQGPVSFAAGKTDQGFLFNGTGGGGVSINNAAAFDFLPSSSFSIAGWFNTFGPTAAANDSQIMAIFNYDCHNTVQVVGIQNAGPNAGKLYFVIRDANGVSQELDTPTAISSNQFHHVVAVRDVIGTNKTVRLFVDGVLVVSKVDPTTAALASNTTDWIGRRSGCTPDDVFNGIIDEVAMFNRALTSQEVATLYNSGAAGMCQPYPRLVVEQPAGTVLVNDSSIINFGTGLVSGITKRAFTLRNTGNQNLSISSITIDDVNAADFTVVQSPAFVVAPGSNTSLSVAFTPTSPGAKAATLHIASNDPDRSRFDIALLGNAVATLDFAQQAYLKASNTEANDYFGYSVAMSGDTVVVSAFQDSSSATGVNGDSSNNLAPGAGAAYIFVRKGTNWIQQAYLKASNTGAGDNFGYSVAISGETVAVGAYLEDGSFAGVNGNQNDNSAPNAGAVYVFVRNGTNWSQQAYIKASNARANDYFGQTVALSGDTLVVADIYEQSNATGVNGNQNDTSVPTAGAAYVFVRNGNTWSQQAYLKASNTGVDDHFGQSVAISGDTVVVGASFEDSSSVGVNGDQNNNGALNSGAAYVFVRSGTNWAQQTYLKAANTGPADFFGNWVAVSDDTIGVGAPGESSSATGVNGNQNDNSAINSGAVYVFVRTGTNWTQQAYLKASNAQPNDNFGVAVSLSGDVLAVSAHGEASSAKGVNGNQSDNSAPDSGTAYVFGRAGTNWTQQAYLKASNTGAGDGFSYPVSVSGGTLVAGAYAEDSNAKGVNGNQNDNSATDAGAAYVFALQSLTTCTPPPAGLVSWWRGERNCVDSVGTNHGILVGGATFAPGEVGTAFSFDGINDYVDLGAGFDLDAMTLEAWVLIDPAKNTGQRRVISKDNDGLAGVRKLFTLNSSAPAISGRDGHAAFGVLIGADVDVVEAPSILTAGWHHLAGVRDQSAGRLELYVDGQRVGNKINPVVVGPIDGDVHVVLGQVSPRDNVEFFEGLIDEPAIYNRALSFAEIAAIYFAATTGKCANTLPSLSPQPGILQITSLAFGSVPTPGAAGGAASAVRLVTLSCHGPAHRTFEVERSPDLINWFTEAAGIEEVTPGEYQARVAAPGAGNQFYRLRMSQ